MLTPAGCRADLFPRLAGHGGRRRRDDPRGLVHNARCRERYLLPKARGGRVVDETKISDSLATSSNACIAEGGRQLHVAWTDCTGAFTRSTTRAGTRRGWSADERVTYWTDVDYCPSIAVGDSAVYLVWQRNTGDPIASAMWSQPRGQLRLVGAG